MTLRAISVWRGFGGSQHQTRNTKQRSRWAVAVKAMRPPRNQPRPRKKTTSVALVPPWGARGCDRYVASRPADGGRSVMAKCTTCDRWAPEGRGPQEKHVTPAEL